MLTVGCPCGFGDIVCMGKEICNLEFLHTEEQFRWLTSLNFNVQLL